jgi:hypothetical protein
MHLKVWQQLLRQQLLRQQLLQLPHSYLNRHSRYQWEVLTARLHHREKFSLKCRE